MSEEGPADPESLPIHTRASAWVFGGLVAILVLGLAAFSLLRPKPAPAPPDVASDPLLAQGYELYLSRCVSCHGSAGKGDGPIARGLSGPPPGDLTDAEWKHGDQPEQVTRVISQGVAGTGMPGWKGTFTDEEIRALAAYTYYLAGRPVPEALRNGR